MKKILSVALILFVFSSLLKTTNAQIDKGFPVEKYKRNVIRWNLTPFLLWSNKNINFSYERVLKPHQSFSVNAGYFVLPTAGIFDSLNIQSSVKNSGFTVSGDYRFYFKKQNPEIAPSGLFWGPFASFHFYQFENEITVIDNPDIHGAVMLDGNYSIFSTGVELGYQFIIKERLSIDLVFIGPSISAYSGKLGLSGEITSEEYNDYLEAIRDILIDRVPILNELITEGNVNDKGVNTSFGLGFRYLLQVGYRF